MVSTTVSPIQSIHTNLAQDFHIQWPLRCSRALLASHLPRYRQYRRRRVRLAVPCSNWYWCQPGAAATPRHGRQGPCHGDRRSRQDFASSNVRPASCECQSVHALHWIGCRASRMRIFAKHYISIFILWRGAPIPQSRT